MKSKSRVNITTMRKFDKYKLLSVIQLLNSWKRKIKWLISLNPTVLYISYVIFLAIPFIPNFALYLILFNKKIPKIIKMTCLVLSIIVAVISYLLTLYYLIN